MVFHFHETSNLVSASSSSPTIDLVKARKVRLATRRLHGRLADSHASRLSFVDL
jgi:hypothetical protein